MAVRQNIVDYINNNPPISGGMAKNQIYAILYNLEDILNKNIEGDIVELGCCVGTTALYIRRWLDLFNSNKQYHVYDSWEGLPYPTQEDASNHPMQFTRGFCKTTKEVFLQNFKTNNLSPPIIHSGWFKDIPDNEYPEKIAFAFYDGDFYSSIMDSFNKTWCKLVPGAVIMIDDCGWDALPGCETAVKEFLCDKEEDYSLLAYPDNEYKFGVKMGGGRIIKL
tara:strand:+ start:5016 stop:5681 length:666 start_codon:yes stop_codon:yes gene_type:complete